MLSQDQQVPGWFSALMVGGGGLPLQTAARAVVSLTAASQTPHLEASVAAAAKERVELA